MTFKDIEKDPSDLFTGADLLEFWEEPLVTERSPLRTGSLCLALEAAFQILVFYFLQGSWLDSKQLMTSDVGPVTKGKGVVLCCDHWSVILIELNLCHVRVEF